MIGVKFQIQKTIQEINKILIHPHEALTQSIFDINFYIFTNKCFNITQMLLNCSQGSDEVKNLFKQLSKKMSQVSKLRPQDDQDQLFTNSSNDQVRTYLNKRKPFIQSNQSNDRKQLYKFLAIRQIKQKDNLSYLPGVDKIKQLLQPLKKNNIHSKKTHDIYTQTQNIIHQQSLFTISSTFQFNFIQQFKINHCNQDKQLNNKNKSNHSKNKNNSTSISKTKTKKQINNPNSDKQHNKNNKSKSKSKQKQEIDQENDKSNQQTKKLIKIQLENYQEIIDLIKQPQNQQILNLNPNNSQQIEQNLPNQHNNSIFQPIQADIYTLQNQCQLTTSKKNSFKQNIVQQDQILDDNQATTINKKYHKNDNLSKLQEDKNQEQIQNKKANYSSIINKQNITIQGQQYSKSSKISLHNEHPRPSKIKLNQQQLQQLTKISSSQQNQSLKIKINQIKFLTINQNQKKSSKRNSNQQNKQNYKQLPERKNSKITQQNQNQSINSKSDEIKSKEEYAKNDEIKSMGVQQNSKTMHEKQNERQKIRQSKIQRSQQISQHFLTKQKNIPQQKANPNKTPSNKTSQINQSQNQLPPPLNKNQLKLQIPQTTNLAQTILQSKSTRIPLNLNINFASHLNQSNKKRSNTNSKYQYQFQQLNSIKKNKYNKINNKSIDQYQNLNTNQILKINQKSYSKLKANQSLPIINNPLNYQPSQGSLQRAIKKKQNQQRYNQNLKNICKSYHLAKKLQKKQSKIEQLQPKHNKQHQKSQKSLTTLPQFIKIDSIQQKLTDQLLKNSIDQQQLASNQIQLLHILQNIKKGSTGAQFNKQQHFKHYNKYSTKIKQCVKILQIIHQKTCGQHCKHLQRFYANLKNYKLYGKQFLKLPTFTVGTNILL